MHVNSFLKTGFYLLVSTIFVLSCKKDEPVPEPAVTPGEQSVFDYKFNNGQEIDSTYYSGQHHDLLSAQVTLINKDTGTLIVLKINNTVEGKLYTARVYDSGNTTSKLPMSSQANTDVLDVILLGNGGTIVHSQFSALSYSKLINEYSGFFVIHDPNQNVNSQKVKSHLVFGPFGRQPKVLNLKRSKFSYEFNMGQVDSIYAYNGSHDSTLTAELFIQELANQKCRAILHLNNTMNGKSYEARAHDLADTATTPNSTPYLETVNSDYFNSTLLGNGGKVFNHYYSIKSFDEITQNYEGYLIIHDPNQPVTTANPKTFVIFNRFAR